MIISSLVAVIMMSAPVPALDEPDAPVQSEPLDGPDDAVAAEDDEPEAPRMTDAPDVPDEPEPQTAVAIPPTSPVVEAAASPVPPKWEIDGAPGKGLTVKVGDKFSLNIRARFQLRYQLVVPTADDDGDRSLQQTVNIGTARLWFSGNIITPKLTYMIQLAVAGRDYRDGTISPVFDAYLDWAAHRDIRIKAGQFFVPFDRLRTVREFALQLADRPRPVGELTLDRDAGVVLYSENFLHDKSPVAYRVGAFGGGGTNLVNGKKPGGLFVGRFELRPLGPIDDDSEGDLERRKRPGLALGGAFAANVNTDRVRSTTGASYAGGTTHYYHGAADLVFKWRGWAIQGEYLRRWASVSSIESVDDEGMPLIEYTRSGQGWVAQTSYVFDPPIEIVGRLSGMYALSGTDPALVTDLDNRGQEVAAGLNYYFNGHRMKLQTDWIALMPRDFDFRRAEHIVHLLLDVTF